MDIGPREIQTPFRPIPLDVPDGMKPNEFFNSTENLNDLVNNNGLLLNREDLTEPEAAVLLAACVRERRPLTTHHPHQYDAWPRGAGPHLKPPPSLQRRPSFSARRSICASPVRRRVG